MILQIDIGTFSRQQGTSIAVYAFFKIDRGNDLMDCGTKIPNN